VHGDLKFDRFVLNNDNLYVYMVVSHIFLPSGFALFFFLSLHTYCKLSVPAMQRAYFTRNQKNSGRKT
jgi:hypothetical protein